MCKEGNLLNKDPPSFFLFLNFLFLNFLLLNFS